MFPATLYGSFRNMLLRVDRVRIVFVVFADGVSAVAAILLAFLLRFDFAVPAADTKLLRRALVIWPISKLTAFAIARMEQCSWRHVSIEDLRHLLLANVFGLGIAGTCCMVLHQFPPRSIWVIDLLLCFLITSGLRLLARVTGEFCEIPRSRVKRRRVLIYGAGAAGIALLREIRQNPSLKYYVCGFIDDSPKKKSCFLYGVQVVGTGAELPSVAAKFGVELALIAAPSASGPQLCSIIERCRNAGLEFKTVPTIAERIGNSRVAHQLRDVAVEDLLGRSPVRLEQDRIAKKLAGRTVLVTGAAGSIGSELCRQIAQFGGTCIVGYETAETPLFQLQQEMGRLFPRVKFIPVIGSIQNTLKLAEVFERYRPAVVYHAAAYKHVPLMESEMFEAVENNVFGTLNVALAADTYGAEDLVMISSDKAVRPTNVMGATKRVAEAVIGSLQNGRVKYVSVRFGNVLNSNGSVVPIFKEQIARGGPVTVTHPEMRRYFMTIPEACQLVLQSSTMGKGGEIFVLDMGSPVRIVDLARNLILLSGLRPDKDIEIKFTGIRPGEKLYEELSAFNEHNVPTYHEKIQIFTGEMLAWAVMEPYLAQLRNACTARDKDALILTLKDIVPEYNPSSDLLRQVLKCRPKALAAVISSGSPEFASRAISLKMTEASEELASSSTMPG